MRRLSIIVRAYWDAEAGVWVAESNDVDGLATEAASLEELQRKILVMVPELLELNGSDWALPEIPVHIMAEHCTMVANPSFR